MERQLGRMSSAVSAAALRRRYLELLKRSLGDFLYDAEKPDGDGADGEAPFFYVDPRSGRTVPLTIYDMRKLHGIEGGDRAHSMIGLKRLDQLQLAVETVLREGVPGDLVETGILRGGACILMRGVLAAHGIGDRCVWGADSFRGFPPRVITPGCWPEQRFYTWAVPRAQVEENFRRYGLFDSQVCLLEGWFAETLPAAPIAQVAVLRLDGDLYESTWDALQILYPKLSPGGFAIIDDYHAWPECRQAVGDYRALHGITTPLIAVDPICVYWRKPGPEPAPLAPRAEPEAEAERLRAMYLELLKRSLGDFLYDRDREALLVRPIPAGPAELADYDRRKAAGLLASGNAQSLIGRARMDHMQTAIETLLREGVPGDLLEAGGLRGGASLLMCGLLDAHGVTDRSVWVAGAPDPAAVAGLEQCLLRYDLLDRHVRILAGSETLPAAPIQALALIHLNTGEAASIEALALLYPRLSPGGFVILAGNALIRAAEAWRQALGITSPMLQISPTSTCWRK
ncbi:MAG: TylF/MycF/NovP-related O-methyltransferase [Candidatus Sericytochromatia bacterium]